MPVAAAIIAAEDVVHPVPGAPTLSAAERTVARWSPDGMPVPRGTSTAAVTYAFVSWGRWSAHCPWCPSSQYASREDHRFFCVHCGNAAAGGQWIAVDWPADWARIEQALSERIDPATRNWVPGETADEAFAENAARGVYDPAPPDQFVLTPAQQQALLAALPPGIRKMLPAGFVPPAIGSGSNG